MATKARIERKRQKRGGHSVACWHKAHDTLRFAHYDQYVCTCSAGKVK